MVDSLALQTQQRQSPFALGVALLPVRHVNLRIAIVVSLNHPFETQIDQGWMVDDQLTWLDLHFSGDGRRAVAQATNGQRDRNSEPRCCPSPRCHTYGLICVPSGVLIGNLKPVPLGNAGNGYFAAAVSLISTPMPGASFRY